MSMILNGIGRLGKDPKMQFTPKGTAKTNFNVATDAGFGDNKKTVWVGMTAYGQLAEVLNQHLQKGSRIGFTAEVENMTTYQGNDGEVKPALYAKVLKVDFIDGIAKSEDVNEPEDF